MKFKTLLLAAAAALMSFSASAQDNNHPTSTDWFTCQNAEGKVGEVLPITVVSHFTEAKFTCVNFDINFAEEIKPCTITKKGKEVLFVADTSDDCSSDDQSWASGIVVNDDTSIRLVGFSMTQSPMFAGDHILGQVFVKPTKEGVYTCHVSRGCLADKSGWDYWTPEVQDFTVTITSSGVNDVTTAKEVASVKYYNVAGMESATPFNGVNVMVTTYVDGTKATAKIVK